MDPLAAKEKIMQYIKKYRYAALVVAIGLILMTLPDRSKEPTEIPAEETLAPELSVSDQLCKILGRIQGVGEVEVMLTCAYGEQIIYQTDSNVSEAEGSNSSRYDTVIITGSDRAQSGLITQVIPPGYLGAVIVCQGADNPSVRLAVVEAVCDVTGLSSDKVSVLKMK